IREHPAVPVALLVHIHPRRVLDALRAWVVRTLTSVLVEDPLLALLGRQDRGVTAIAVLGGALGNRPAVLVVHVGGRVGLGLRERGTDLVPKPGICVAQGVRPGLDVRPVVAAAEQPPCPARRAQRVGEGGELVGRLALAHRERVPTEAVVPSLVQQVGELLVLLVREHLRDVVMMLDRRFPPSVMGRDRGAAVLALGLALAAAGPLAAVPLG